ncbi:hypothetical protein BOX15_Mlig028569g1 [Macrostomum lignano]|uniref:Uncharacterized protein n=1 Tax=Macrostomum lignano TaxID=282301 RepID=A0A267EWM8_9PLAT|nr:hypothetical protein BOX15_Mlig028569g1 [Macrostomum lignano]
MPRKRTGELSQQYSFVLSLKQALTGTMRIASSIVVCLFVALLIDVSTVTPFIFKNRDHKNQKEKPNLQKLLGILQKLLGRVTTSEPEPTTVAPLLKPVDKSDNQLHQAQAKIILQ